VAQNEHDAPDDSADDPIGSPRRYVRKHGRELARRAAECSEAGDEAGYRQMLAELGIDPGTPQFDAAMQGYHRFARERRR
jgi:hypothetical protein